MDFEKLMKRQTILQMALQESFRKRDECQSELDELNQKITAKTLSGCSFKEKDKVVESMLYLQKCKDGWQETINHIRSWGDELKNQ